MIEAIESQRLFYCSRCRCLVSVCLSCDRGQRYCSAQCAESSRREKLREAAARYRKTQKGKESARARQQRFRDRRSSVTHQGPEFAQIGGDGEPKRQLPAAPVGIEGKAPIAYNQCRVCSSIGNGFFRWAPSLPKRPRSTRSNRKPENSRVLDK